MSTADAGFSACGHYRWWLWRQWQPQRPVLLFIGLNPSWADGVRDDPTLRRIVGFARAWGYGSVTVVNLFARISPSPAAVRRCSDPVGPENDRWLRWAAQGPAAAIWLGWGNQGGWQGRDRQVLAMFSETVSLRPLLALGLTAQGQPRHPLYAPAATRPMALAVAQTTGAGASCGQRFDDPWHAPRAAMPFICISAVVRVKPCSSRRSMRFSSGMAGC